MDQQGKQPFAEWAILELMGHRRLAGYVQEVELAGQGLIRIDIPSTTPVTQYYGVTSIYCLTPTTEEIARGLATRVVDAPVHRYELPPAKPMVMCERCERDIDPGEAVLYLGGGKHRCTVCQAILDARDPSPVSAVQGAPEPDDHTDDVCTCGDPDCNRPFGHAD